MASPNMPPFARVPAYRSQLPTSRRVAVITIAGLGPPLFKIQMTRLRLLLWGFAAGLEIAYGLTAQKAKR